MSPATRGSTTLEVRHVAYPVTALGFGRRVGVWLQGCTIRCAGCLVPEAWPRRPDLAVEAGIVVASLASVLGIADGLTVSGGEPFDQPDGLRELLLLYREAFTGDILLFTGYSETHVAAMWPWAFGLADVLVSGPFVSTAPQTLVLRGSDNQAIRLLTVLARERYSASVNELLAHGRRTLDLFIAPDEVHAVGIPVGPAFQQFRAILGTRGYGEA